MIATQKFPPELAGLPQFITWKYVDADDGGKPKKFPVDAKTGNCAKTDTPSTWSTIDVAKKRVETNGCTGIGFVFSEDDEFVGIDLDHVVADDGKVADWAMAIVRESGCYAEYSPSGRGIHVFLRGNLPGSGRRVKVDSRTGTPGGDKDSEIEVYDRRRYFTVTGNQVDGTPPGVANAQATIDKLVAKYFSNSKVTTAKAPASGEISLDDAEIIERIRGSKQAVKFEALWAGNHDGDHSAARMSLLCIFAFWTRDARRIDSLYRASGLYATDDEHREKWQRLGADEITKALDFQTESYTANGGIATAANTTNETATNDEREPLVLFKDNAWPTVDALIGRHYTKDGRRTLYSADGVFMHWNGRQYVETPDVAIEKRLAYLMRNAVIDVKDGQRPFPASSRTLRDALAVLRASSHLDNRTSPFWIRGGDSRPPATGLVSAANGLWDLATMERLDHTPDYFNLHSLDFHIDPAAEPPREFEQLLHDQFDAEQVIMLQQWCGYLLSGDTSLQKALYITGPPRSSKGTLMHLMRDLVGLDNVHDASVANLADRFGLEPLAGKPLAIISDARFASRDTQPVIENLLRIIGGDGVSIQRKGRTNIETILPTRFVIASNEVPKLPDASTAIITRFLFLRTRKSFLGQEDPDLLNKLRRGLPGIFNWSREGWLDLKKQRRFMEPEATKRDRRLAEFLASDVRSFFDEMCVVEMGTSVPCSELYGEFVHWCEQAGIHNPPPANVFGQRLHAAVPIVETKQSTDGREYINIDMRKWATLE